LHKSRRAIWKLQEEGRIAEHNKRQHMNSRRDQVCNLLFKYRELTNYSN
jgi:hypothetical protein